MIESKPRLRPALFKMYTRVKTANQIKNLRASGAILADILAGVKEEARVGTTGKDIDDYVLKMAQLAGARCAFKGYNGFPAHICISLNDEVVHGIPDSKKFKQGDVVSFDFGVIFGSMITDSAFTMVIGENPSGDKKRLLETVEESLYLGLEAVEANTATGDISSAIENVLKPAGLGIFKELVGHGVGHHVHEQPDIPNYGRAGQGAIVQRDMSLAIEPMACLGKAAIKTDRDGWTIRTVDGSLAAHFEHTVLVTDDGCEILTKL